MSEFDQWRELEDTLKEVHPESLELIGELEAMAVSWAEEVVTLRKNVTTLKKAIRLLDRRDRR